MPLRRDLDEYASMGDIGRAAEENLQNIRKGEACEFSLVKYPHIRSVY